MLYLEITYIKEYVRKCDGGILINLTEGGEGAKHSEETRKKLSLIKTGLKASEETKEKLRQYMLKRAPYVFTPEALFKLSESHKGIKQSPETIQKRKDTIAFNKLKKKEYQMK